MMQVFIGGCGRSGTTLLGAMLGAHSECLCTPESQFKIEVLRQLSRHKKDKIDIVTAVNLLHNNLRFKIWDLDINSVSLSQKADEIPYPELLQLVVRAYGEKVGKKNPRIWIDHTPENIHHTSALFELFPEARMIHIVRDGRAVAASVMPLDWGPNTVVFAAHWWAEQIALGLAAESFWGGKRIVQIRFEELLREPENLLKRICSYLDIDYEPEMTKACGFRVPRYTSKQHALIGREPDKGRINAWESRLTPRQVEIFENLTGDLLKYLGYETKYGLYTREMSDREKLISVMKEIYEYIKNRIRLRLRVHSVKK